MKKFYPILLSAAIFSFALVFAISTTGCKEEEAVVDTTPKVTLITEDVFPLTAGRQIVYGGYLRTMNTDTNWTATGAVYKTSWTIVSNAAPSPVGGGTGHALYDSTTIPGYAAGYPTVPSIKVASSLMAKRTTATGISDIYLLQNLSAVFKSTGVAYKPTAQVDSIYYIKLVDYSKGLGEGWSCFDSTWTSATGSKIRMHIKGVWAAAKDTVTGRNAVKYASYKFTATRDLYVGGTLASAGATATVWFYPGVGPVKMILNASPTDYGHFREILSKNF